MAKTMLILSFALGVAAATPASARLSTPAGESRATAPTEAGARYATHDMPAAAATPESGAAETKPAAADGDPAVHHRSLRRRRPHHEG